MIDKLIIIESFSLNPYHNQAVEASLLDIVGPSEMILYIWANDKTVFIGKNQNAFTECDVRKLKEDGGFLARRISGGGAVYHDRGNLNFTFACSRENYSTADNFEIVINAVKSFGISAEISGRNDCTIDGKKFSGNAFYTPKGNCFHHGTVLINTGSAAIAKYLNVSAVKLNAKGVKSVVSRVTNLSEHSPSVNYEKFSAALKKSFTDYWSGREAVSVKTTDIDSSFMNKWHDFFSNEKRIMGDDIKYNFRIERRFGWGTADIRLNISDGIITAAKIYTDSLDPDMSEKEGALVGKNVLEQDDSLVADIIAAVKETL